MALSYNSKKRIRKSFGKIAEAGAMPNLIEVQKSSYEQFLQKDVKSGKRADQGIGRIIDTLAKQHIPVLVHHPHQHHGVHCIAPRKQRTNPMPDSKLTPRRSSWLTTARSVLLMLVTVTARS